MTLRTIEDYPEKIRAKVAEMATGKCDTATLCELASWAMHEADMQDTNERDIASRILNTIIGPYKNSIGIPTVKVSMGV